ncbi:hypothetical protein V8C44DRAFT_190003 [Trichoderma aethiopicum]
MHKRSRKPGLGSSTIVFVLHSHLTVESGRRYPSVLDVRYGAYPPRDGTEPNCFDLNRKRWTKAAHMIS